MKMDIVSKIKEEWLEDDSEDENFEKEQIKMEDVFVPTTIKDDADSSLTKIEIKDVDFKIKEECMDVNSDESIVTMRIEQVFCEEPKWITCSVCGKTFTTLSDLYLHKRLHKKNRYHCHLCDKIFNTNSTLHNHKQYFHVDPQNWKHACHLCEKRFTAPCYLRDHLARHTGEKNFICTICNKAFVTKVYLTQHSVLHTNKQSLECKQCGKMFASIYNLKKHKIRHSNLRLYVCDNDFCEKKFKDRRDLMQHKMEVHKYKPKGVIPCNTCGERFTTIHAMRSHAFTHANEGHFVCTICKKMFQNQILLEEHLKWHSNQEHLKCIFCGKQYKTVPLLEWHKRRIHALDSLN